MVIIHQWSCRGLFYSTSWGSFCIFTMNRWREGGLLRLDFRFHWEPVCHSISFWSWYFLYSWGSIQLRSCNFDLCSSLLVLRCFLYLFLPSRIPSSNLSCPSCIWRDFCILQRRTFFVHIWLLHIWVRLWREKGFIQAAFGWWLQVLPQ